MARLRSAQELSNGARPPPLSRLGRMSTNVRRRRPCGSVEANKPVIVRRVGGAGPAEKVAPPPGKRRKGSAASGFDVPTGFRRFVVRSVRSEPTVVKGLNGELVIFSGARGDDGCQNFSVLHQLLVDLFPY